MAFGEHTAIDTGVTGSPGLSGTAEVAPVLAVVFRQLQSETLMLAMGGVFAGSLGLLGMAPRAADPAWAVATALLMLGLLLAAWLVRGHSFGATSVILVTAALVGVILTVTWGQIPAAVCLLVAPIGLATVLLGAGWGVGLAALLTVGLYGDVLIGDGLTSLAGAAPANDLRAVTTVAIWVTVGLLWIALRPLLTAVEWAWSHFQRSQAALEQARDTQVQLKQALEDLSSANVQLTRLNQLAHGLREAAESARRAKEEFVANVSHELRTPLNMIIGFSRMIVQNPHVYGKRAIPPALLADLTVILRNSQHLASLIDDVLDLSQIEADKMALSRERTDLKDLVDMALTVVRPLFESKRLYLEAEVEDGLPAVLVDRTRIREVLLNLLSNAGRFTEQGGVRVRVERVGLDVRFSIADTGPGIAAADMSKLFQPFQQVDDSLSRRHDGTGLGLTLSKRFVELHGGRMWLESRVGQGSTFYFTLPLDAAPVAPDGPMRWLKADWSMLARTRRSLAPAADVRPRFVVLDEAGTLHRLATRYLDGCEIVAVPDLAAAVEELAEAPAHALLIAEPGGLSWAGHQERLPAIASIPDDTPVLLCSIPGTGWPKECAETTTNTNNTNGTAQDGSPDGLAAVADYLVKPVSAEALAAAVRDSLRTCGANPDGPATILLVDDEPDELRLFWRMLAATGHPYRVLTAGNGVEALEILRDQRPDVVVSDLVMPEMDGFQLVAAKNAIPELRHIPLVIISARDPQGQPIVAESVTAIRAGGLSVPQLLACIEALSGILSPLPAPANPSRS